MMDLATRHRYMKAMGIPLWVPRSHDAAEEVETPPVQHPVTPNSFNTEITNQPPISPLHQPHPSPAASLAQAIDKQPLRPSVGKPSTSKASTAEINVVAPDCSTLDWQTLQTTVSQCQLCELHRSRTQTVFGTGNRQADWMIIGEAPGANEDRQGEPFVGRAGQLLNNMLAALGMPREAVYIGNILKCRPPNNRDPKPEESALCRGYLERQIALVNPALIMVVGRIAAHNLLQVNTPLGRLRGKVHELPGTDIPVIVGYHPAYLLRQPAEKRKAWQDLKLAREVMANRLAR